MRGWAIISLLGIPLAVTTAWLYGSHIFETAPWLLLVAMIFFLAAGTCLMFSLYYEKRRTHLINMLATLPHELKTLLYEERTQSSGEQFILRTRIENIYSPYRLALSDMVALLKLSKVDKQSKAISQEEYFSKGYSWIVTIFSDTDALKNAVKVQCSKTTASKCEHTHITDCIIFTPQKCTHENKCECSRYSNLTLNDVVFLEVERLKYRGHQVGKYFKKDNSIGLEVKNNIFNRPRFRFSLSKTKEVIYG